MWYEQKESKGGERGAEGQGEALLRRRQAACHVGIWQWRAQACQAGVLAGLLSLSFHSKAEANKSANGGKKKHQTKKATLDLPRSSVVMRSTYLHLGHTFLLSSGSACFHLGPQIQTKTLLKKSKETHKKVEA